jgi:polyisoprenoid-binding protein YceI
MVRFRGSRGDQRGEQRLAVTGDLTIRDVSREVSLDATIDRREPFARFTATATTTIARRDFGVGLRFPRFMAGEDLRIRLEVAGERIAGE